MMISFLLTNTPDQTHILDHCIKTTNYLFTPALFLLILFPYHEENKTLKILSFPYIPTKRQNSGKSFISLLHPHSAVCCDYLVLSVSYKSLFLLLWEAITWTDHIFLVIVSLTTIHHCIIFLFFLSLRSLIWLIWCLLRVLLEY